MEREKREDALETLDLLTSDLTDVIYERFEEMSHHDAEEAATRAARAVLFPEEQAEINLHTPSDVVDPEMLATLVVREMKDKMLEEGIIFPQLARTLINASSHAGRLYSYFEHMPSSLEPRRGREVVSMMRVAATLRDSLLQVARLVEGEELEEPLPREFEVEPQWTPDQTADEGELRAAFAFQRLKAIRGELIGLAGAYPTAGDRETWAEIIREIMLVLSGEKPIPKETT